MTNRVNALVRIKIGMDRANKRGDGAKLVKLAHAWSKLRLTLSVEEYSEYLKRILMVIAMVLMASNGWTAEPVTDARLVHAIVAEALHDQESLNYMACAMHNRFLIKGDLRGVYGDKANIGQISPLLRHKAQKALNLARSGSDVTHGATHWLSDWDLGHCKPERMAWRFKMAETAYQGQTHYYREIR